MNGINEVLSKVEYGTLALSDNNKPYSLPINFVEIDGNIYFHGAKKGRKIDIIKSNNNASFSVVEPYSVIPSFYSSKNGLACPATHFFKSIIIDGLIEFVTDYNEKVLALEGIMKKLQPEGNYQNMEMKVYNKSINATVIFKLIPVIIDIKIKFGQRISQERFKMILEHLIERNTEKDIQTIALMKKYRNNNKKIL